MRERLRVLFAAVFYYSGLVRLASWWMQRSGRHLIILNYHRAKGDNLRRQMRYLRRNYRLMHLEDALEEFYAPHHREQRSRSHRDRRIPMVLTFDDGYLDNYIFGLRFARELQVPITVFLIPGSIESGACFWWLAADFLVNHTYVDQIELEGQRYNLANPEDRQALARWIDGRLRFASSVQERESFLSAMQQALGVALPTRAELGSDNTDLPLSWDEICEMERSGWISFGAHTMHHPVLGYLASAEEVQYEVSESRRVLEQRLGHAIQTFAYPIGKMEHIGEQGYQAVRAAGYSWALTTIEEINSPETNAHLLRRLPGDETLHWMVMAAELVGLLGIVSRIKKMKSHEKSSDYRLSPGKSAATNRR